MSRHKLRNNQSKNRNTPPQEPKYTYHPKLKHISPKTNGQIKAFDIWNSGLNLCQHGSTGTGKTLTSLYLALQSIEDEIFEKIIIIRSAVSTRDQGFLPGGLKEKQAVYESAYINVIEELYGSASYYHTLKSQGKLIFTTTSFLRGLNFNNAVVYFDEFQNATEHEIDTVITRLSDTSRFIFSGDFKQKDLNKPNDESGILRALKRFELIPKYVQTVNYKPEDIVRSGLCKEWVLTDEKV